MPSRPKSNFKWKEPSKSRAYDSKLLGEDLRFYESFIKNDRNFRIGEYAIIHINNRMEINESFLCCFKCLFEERGQPKAIVQRYLFASSLSRSFSQLNIDFDPRNDVVRDVTGDTVINLMNVAEKCRIIFGLKDETVSELIDAKNLNRKIYYICRYEYNEEMNLGPIIDETLGNTIDIEYISMPDDYIDKTPSKEVTNPEKPCIKKKSFEAMEIENNIHVPHLHQVKRNLNNSFNDSFLSEDDQYPHYSVVKLPADKSLKIKLKVSNHKVLTQIPSTQPIVLMHNSLETVSQTEEKSIFEIKSPIFQELIKENLPKSTTLDGSSTPNSKKVEVISDMVQNLKINNEACVRVSPRKLRKVSSIYYRENFSDSDSENDPCKRKLVDNGRRKSCLNDGPVNIMEERLRPKSRCEFNDHGDAENKSRRLSTRRRKTVNYADFFSSEASSKRKSSRNIENFEGVEHEERQNQRQENDVEIVYCDEFENDGPEKSHSNELEHTPKRIARRTNTKTVEFFETEDSPRIGRRRTARLSSAVTPSRTLTSNKLESERKPIKTPLKLIREGVLTPSIDQRKKSVLKASTPLVMARNNLHVSYMPKMLPCRENEYRDIYNFIRGKLEDKCGGCMYISGVPGTGKTATVTTAIENIITSWKDEGNPMFNYININGMKLTEPRQCYVEILKQLTGKRIPWEQALSVLEAKFTTKSTKKIVPTVLVVDELDILCTKRQDVVYNLLDWPTKANAQLIVVTIANTMDLPERLLMSRVTSRLGLTRLTFQAYNYKQLQEIVVDRLTGNNSFKADAIQFVARKVASVSGDARRALDICRRSAEIAELEGPNVQVSMSHVNAALDAMITQPKVKAIAHCSKLEKLLLKSIIAEVERTGVEETTLGGVYTMLSSLAPLEGFKMVSMSLVFAAVYRLSSCRLILVEQKCVDFNQRIILNVSSDDVYYALKNGE